MGDPISWTVDKVKYWNHIVWHTPLSKLTKRKTFLLKQVRIFYIAIKGFLRDKVQTQASALTLNTLLAIVPVAAIAFAIAKGFGLDQNLTDMLEEEFASHQEILNWLLTNAQNALQQTKGGYLAGIGVVILVYSVMALLSNIESSFNHIWQISNSRGWTRKFTDYLAMMIIAPIFIILSGSISVFVEVRLTSFISSAPILAFFKPIVGFSFKFAPFLLTWIVLTIIYIVIPNTKVKFVPALVAGMIAGTLLKLLMWVYIDMQMGITKLSAIYGSFAAIPLLIIWLQTSWLLILLGAELSFANQNLSQYEQESEALSISHFQKRSLSIVIMKRIINNFANGEKALSSAQLGTFFKLPVRLVRDIMKNLYEVGLVSMIHDDKEKEVFYQPAIDINLITVGMVITKLDKQGSDNKLDIDDKEYDAIVGVLKKHDKHALKAEYGILIREV